DGALGKLRVERGDVALGVEERLVDAVRLGKGVAARAERLADQIDRRVLDPVRAVAGGALRILPPRLLDVVRPFQIILLLGGVATAADGGRVRAAGRLSRPPGAVR